MTQVKRNLFLFLFNKIRSILFRYKLVGPLLLRWAIWPLGFNVLIGKSGKKITFSTPHLHRTCALLTHEKASKMAESLRRLVNIGTFTVLQEKLERWLDNYYVSKGYLHVYSVECNHKICHLHLQSFSKSCSIFSFMSGLGC